MDPHPELLHQQPKQFLKLLVIGFSIENQPSFDATVNHLVPRSRNQHSQRPRHSPFIIQSAPKSNFLFSNL
jgi:hypothetical protein